MREPVPRVGGRLLLVDPEDRLLLIHERLEDGSTHWLTPGGGVEDGEQPGEAAMREAMEEVGFSVQVEPGAEAVLVTQRLWSWAETTYDQTDHFFLVRVPSGLEPRARALTEVEQLTLLGFRWWTMAELQATAAVLVPADLGDVLAGVLQRAPSGG